MTAFAPSPHLPLLSTLLRLRAEARGAPVRALPPELRERAATGLELGLVAYSAAKGWTLTSTGRASLPVVAVRGTEQRAGGAA